MADNVLILNNNFSNKELYRLGRQKISQKPHGFGNTSRRFPQTGRRTKGNIAKDHFAFEQALQGNDCLKLRRGGDFLVQKRDFFGDKEGELTVVDVKTGNARVTEAESQRRRGLGWNRHKIVRY
jgi:hypothetical protein